MADNIAITAGTGTTVSTEEVTTLNGGAVPAQQVQRVANAIRTADGAAIDLPGDATNGLDVDVTRLPAGNNHLGGVSLDAQATGGYTPGKLISAATTNATSVTAVASTLGYITASNVNASPRYLKLYNKASSPTVGTDTPVHTFLIPGNTAGAGTNIPLPPQGIAFSNGIALALTTGVADNDTAAVAANEIVVNYGTK